MKDDAYFATPRDVANQAEVIVAAVPRRVLRLLLNLGISQVEGGAEHLSPGWREAQLSNVQKIINYVREEFPGVYIEAAGTMSDDLEAACKALAAGLETFCDMFPNSEAVADIADIAAMGTHVEAVLEPATSYFLGAMFDCVVFHEKASAKRAQDVDSNSLTEIDQISRKIKFIAINATVEAARVGDTGRAFAVIASEIKTLSEQTQEAVDRIRSELG